VSPSDHNEFRWLANGQQAFTRAMLAIDQATRSLDMEMYIFAADAWGRAFLEHLVGAAKRGVTVRVLVDSFGSITLSDSFWQPLREVVGEVRWFNPISLGRYAFRDHRKLLVCDNEVGFVGGFNISSDYAGDGVTSGWRDLGLEIRGPAAAMLSQAFEASWNNADLRQPRIPLVRRARSPAAIRGPQCDLLLSGPGRNSNFIQRQLLNDLRRAQEVDIMVAYFLPTLRLRYALTRVARRGGRVRMIFAGKSDVPISQYAAQSLYGRLLRAGVGIWEYQPQILHAKIIVIDDIVYVGSSNLDTRSLQINYELMLRVKDPKLAGEARQIITDDQRYSLPVSRDSWRARQTIWSRLRQRWAHFLFTRIDMYFARRQMKLLR
jgi:cardiolipin synthase